jgi:hypothetical protein
MSNEVVHKHNLATQLTLVILAFPYWRRVGRDSLNSEYESTTLPSTASFRVIGPIICVLLKDISRPFDD